MLHHSTTTTTLRYSLEIHHMILANCYFACFMNSHIGVASHNDSRYVVSADTYVVNGLHHRHQISRYIMLKNQCHLCILRVLVILGTCICVFLFICYKFTSCDPSQNMSMNVRIGYANVNCPAN
jgi:hypothetical protein